MSDSSRISGRRHPKSSEPAYALTRSAQEYDRLSRQAAFLGSTTDRLFQAAGLRPGMRILDVGSGSGDVALLAAEIVGPTGRVVGVDIDGAALEVARARAQSMGLQNVTFIEADARTADLDHNFDGVVSRLVLMYWGDPAGGLERLAGNLRPGGVLVCQELDLDPAFTSRSLPESTLWTDTGRLVIETFMRAGMQPRMGRRLFAAYRAAGLPAPTMCDEALIGGGPDFAGYDWLAGVARGLAPVMVKLGIADIDQLGLDTLSEQIRDDALRQSAVVWTPSLVGAYALKPES